MNELYNEISSSDDEDEDNSTANSDAKTATSQVPAASASGNNTSSSPQKPATSVEKQDGGDGAAGGGELANPFKRQVSAQASEALRELYGDDSEESGGEKEEDLLGFSGDEEEQQQQESGENQQKPLRRRDMVAAKLGSWMSKAKDKYVDNPESRVNHVKNSVKGNLIKVMLGAATVDDEKYLVHKSILDETTTSAGASDDLKPPKNSCDAPKTETDCKETVEELQKRTESEMANPYNTSLSQFLALEQAKMSEK